MRKLKPSPINLHHFQRKAWGNLMEKPLGSGPQLICFVILVKRFLKTLWAAVYSVSFI